MLSNPEEFMRRAMYRAERAIPTLREAEVEIGHGKSIREVCRKSGIHEHTNYHRPKEYGA